ncbi:MAG: hypothetical protein IJI36_14700 [Kiritimatiellae bacterium]|nr:hypothetical protein [Kiritimatiellia bacterium]
MFLIVAVVWATHAEKLTVYPPARTAEEKIATRAGCYWEDSTTPGFFTEDQKGQ